MRTCDVAIIGAGPAGIAAGIQLLRCGFRPMLFDERAAGGLLWNAHRVENYPGFPGGISGPRLARRMVRQLLQTGGVVHHGRVTSVDIDLDLDTGSERSTKRSFRLRTPLGEIETQTVVIATGTKPRSVTDVEISEDAKDRIFRHVWPMRRIRGREIAIIGAGDAAFDYALTLARHNDVLIVQRSASPRCLPLLREQVADQRRVRILREHSLLSVSSHGACLRLTLGSEEGIDALTVDRVVIATGREPNLSLLSQRVLDQRDALTTSKRLFLSGDVVRGLSRQASIAVGDGVLAAMTISRLRDVRQAEQGCGHQ